MRIIRAFFGLWVIAIMLFAPISKAQAGEETNETKINFKIQDNIVIENGIARDKNDIFLSQAPFRFPGYEPVLSEREKEIRKMEARFSYQKRNSVLPKGKFTVNASAYTAAADECGKSDGITASGLKVKEKETLACPPRFPFGTKIKIDGFGTYMCQDRGGAIKGNHVDIYVETKSEAFAFGRRNLLAEVVM